MNVHIIFYSYTSVIRNKPFNPIIPGGSESSPSSLLKEWILDSEREQYNEPEYVKKSEDKVLGVKWDAKKDVFVIGVDNVVEKALMHDGPITKRFMLKTTASHYDPIGILSPITVRFKYVIQEAYRMKLSWDAKVTGELAQEWEKLLRSCAKLDPFVVERNYLCQRQLRDVTDMQLHGFSDASGKSYACVIYLRAVFTDGDILTTFIASKTKVAPIKKLTIPRLELMACVLLSELIKVVKESITDYKINSLYCWTDNMDCLYWINSHGKVWDRFTNNRVKVIRENLPEVYWRFCPGVQNPADIPSRGLDVTNPGRREKWLNGPKYLRLPQECWPINPEVLKNDRDEMCKEDKNVSVNVAFETLSDSVDITLETKLNMDVIINKRSFNSFKKLVMVTAYVMRFIDNCRRLIKKMQLKQGEISLDERMHAKRLWLRNEQSQINEKQLNQFKQALGAYRDENDIIKLKGRLEHAGLNVNTKFPVLIPKSSYIGDLIILDAHVEVLHYGMKDTLNQVRSEYWLVQGRRWVKGVLRRWVKYTN